METARTDAAPEARGPVSAPFKLRGYVPTDDHGKLPWRIVNGVVLEGVFETEREWLLAEACSASARAWNASLRQREFEAYERGAADAKAVWAPRTWLGRLFG